MAQCRVGVERQTQSVKCRCANAPLSVGAAHEWQVASADTELTELSEKLEAAHALADSTQAKYIDAKQTAKAKEVRTWPHLVMQSASTDAILTV